MDISSVASLSEQKLKSTEWAEMIDVASSVDNFHQLIPNPAHTWPFELDNFQKHVRGWDLICDRGHVWYCGHFLKKR